MLTFLLLIIALALLPAALNVLFAILYALRWPLAIAFGVVTVVVL